MASPQRRHEMTLKEMALSEDLLYAFICWGAVYSIWTGGSVADLGWVGQLSLPREVTTGDGTE